MYYAGANAVLLVFDLNNRRSFENLKFWREETEDLLSARIPTVVIGNKNDLDPQVTPEQMGRFAADHCCSILTCSAKSGKGVNEVIDKVIKTLIAAQEID